MSKRNFKHDVILTAVFAVIVGAISACGGGSLVNNPLVQGGKSLVHLITVPFSGHRIMPSTSGPVEANMFYYASTPSQIAQSYDVTCSVFQGLSPTPGSLLPIPASNSNNLCNQFTDTPIPATDQPSSKPTFFDGTLTTLVVTGKTVGGARFQCRDVQTQFAISDNSFTQAFLDPFAHSVKIYNQLPNGSANAAPFVCNGIGSDTDPVATIEVQFAKI